MADVRAFFESYLPEKFAKHPEIPKDINAVYQFSLGDEGVWTVDLTGDGVVTEGEAENPGCVVTCAGSDFNKLLDNPASSMMLFTMGKLKVTDIALGMKLQKLFS